MDVSNIYVKMCDCPEIQERIKLIQCLDYSFSIWNIATYSKCPKCGWYGYRDGEFCTLCGTGMKLIKEGYLSRHKESSSSIWLPTQDQIQEIMYSLGETLEVGKASVACPDVIVSDLKEFSEHDCEYKLNSMEQLWLAFYMHEYHQLIWDGSKWKKEK